MGTILVFNVVRYICLKDRGGKRELFCLLICSPNGCGSRDSARPKPGAECFFEISVAGAILWRFCSSISREQLGLKLMGCWLHRRQLYPLCQRQSLTFLPIKIWEVESQRGGRKADMSSLFSVFPQWPRSKPVQTSNTYTWLPATAQYKTSQVDQIASGACTSRS